MTPIGEQMSGTAVEHVEAQDLEARKHLNRVLVTADQMAGATLVLRADLRNKVQDVRAIALTLDQHGLPITIQNVNACYVVNGAVEFMTRLWTGLAMARGHHRVWICDADPDKCKCTAPSSAEEGRAHLQRGDDGMTYTATFSWADAERAGLTGSATYKKFPQDMLGWRALSRVVKRYAPDIVIGVGEALPDTVAVARPRPPAFDTEAEYARAQQEAARLLDADEEIVDGEIVEPEQGEDPGVPPEQTSEGAGAATAGTDAPAAPSGPIAGDEPEEGDNAAAEVVGPQTAPLPRRATGGIDWRELAKRHQVTVGGLHVQARRFAQARGLEPPAEMKDVVDEQLVADVVDWLGPA